MGLCDSVRKSCAAIAATASWVRIDEARLEQLALPVDAAPALDPEVHLLDGAPADVAHFLLCLDAINFGSGWFGLLRKRPGRSGYMTVALSLSEHYRAEGPLSLAEITTKQVAAILDQPPQLELMGLYAQALRQLGSFLGGREPLDLVRASPGAEQFAAELSAGMAMWADEGFFKRAQIAAADMALAGLADWPDLARLTIFADNVVPHVLRVEGVLSYAEPLARLVDGGRLLRPGGPHEREIRACAVHACELLAGHLGLESRLLDNILWTQGRQPRYKERPRHRCRTVYY